MSKSTIKVGGIILNCAGTKCHGQFDDTVSDYIEAELNKGWLFQQTWMQSMNEEVSMYCPGCHYVAKIKGIK